MLKLQLTRLVLLLTFLIISLSGCTSNESSTSQQSTPSRKDVASSIQVIPPSDPDLEAKAAVSIPQLINACPGLNWYAADISVITVGKSYMIDYEGGIELQFKVVDNPKVLPSPLNIRCAKNNCYIVINKEGTKAYIAKRACHSICSGEWQENDPNLMGREYSL